ncbi:hypothetical protein AQUCO_04500096v1 [Aquilegia coerulea]|uniref:Mitochondrial import inner membrane translocase subunit TIM50 n=1 Tax=Aquilegia coerulea TaxID=218851 RepID=A0A2G5CLR3_AQUCA|nr:hypothetical protein AQUCO_04500096v1 [Aquilegia coerulea]
MDSETETTQASSTELYAPDYKKGSSSSSITSLVWTSLLSWLTFLLFPLFFLLNHALLRLPSIYSSASSFNFKPLPVVELTTTDQQQDLLPPPTAQLSGNKDDDKQDVYEEQKIKKLTVVLDLDETLVCAYETSSLPDIIRNRAIESGLKWFDLECLSSDKESDGTPKVNHVTVFERPGLQEFLEKVSEFADLVLFTAGLESYARPLVDRIDVDNRFVSRLYRPSTTSTCWRYSCLFLSDCLCRKM